MDLQNRSNIIKPLGSALFGLAILGVTAVTLTGAYYLDKIYPGVKIAGHNVGGLTRQAAKEKLKSQLVGYRLHLDVEGKGYDLTPSELGVSYDLNTTVDVAFNRGRHVFPIIMMLQKGSGNDIGLAYTVDQPSLQGFVSQLSVSQTQAPVDAAIVIVNGQPTVEPEKIGTGLDPKQVTRLLEAAISTQTETLSVSAQTIQPEVKVADTTAAIEAAKKLMANRVELKYNGRTFTPSAAAIGNWLVFTKQDGKLAASVDPGKVKGYLKSVNDAIYIAPKNHLINVVNGERKGEEEGKEGLGVDQDNLANQIVAALPGATGSLSLAVPTMVLPFKTVYNRTINLDFGRYIEVNLSQQRLWAYQDHQVVFSTAITSGATGAGFPTVQGLFSIYNKQRNRNLNGYAIGYDYNVFVNYWMPFHKDYGLHDASWRSSFGGQDYYYGGSHGCVNMPLESAAWVYNWAEVGTPVWVHT